MTFHTLDFLRLKNRQHAIPSDLSQEFPPEFFQYLSESWAELSFAYAGLDPEGRLLAAEGFPGYLTTVCSEWKVYVPWPLVTCFPGQKVLSELLALGNTITIPPVTNLCVSGSAAGLGKDIVVGDLDYCQYVQLTPAAIVQRAENFRQVAPNRLLVNASYGSRDHKVTAYAPWDKNWPTLAAAMTVVETIDGAQRFMVNVVSQNSFFGSMQVSMVVLSADFNDRTRGAAQSSFVYQEAVATPKDTDVAPPWTLVDPRQLAGYLNFLHEEISENVTDKPLKAVKRALSFAHTIRLDTFVSDALDILISPEAASYVKRGRTAELKKLIERLSAEEQVKALAFIQQPLTDSGNADVDELDQSLSHRCRDYVAKLLQEVERLKHLLDQRDM